MAAEVRIDLQQVEDVAAAVADPCFSEERGQEDHDAVESMCERYIGDGLAIFRIRSGIFRLWAIIPLLHQQAILILYRR